MATFYKGNTYRGTSGNDDFLITGNDSYNDTYYGYGGNDSFYHSTGNDYFSGGDGEDRISYASAPGGVVVFLGAGWAHDGTGGTDTLSGIEEVTGSQFNDMLVGSDSRDVIRGGAGQDKLFGAGGGDTLHADSSDLVVDGGAGWDWMHMSLNIRATVTLDNDGTGTVATAFNTVRLVSIEALFLRDSVADVDFLGNDLGNLVYTGSGDDTIIGGAGTDEIHGEAGDDTINGGAGDDHLEGGVGADTFVFDHLGVGSENQFDQVVDFEVGIDRIDLGGTGVQGFDDLLTPGDRYMEQVGNDVLIHTSVQAGTTISLRNLQMSSLTADDFLF